MASNLQPPQAQRGSGAAYRHDRTGFALRAAREHGEVWKLQHGVYVAAAADSCRAVLQRTTHEFTTLPGTFPPVKRPGGQKPRPGEFAQGHAARMRGLRPRAVAARIPVIASGAAAFAADWPVDADVDVDVLPRAYRALAGIGGRYLFSDDAAELLAAGAGLGRARDDINRSPWPRRLPTPARRRLAYHQAHFVHRLQQVIDRRRSEGGDRDDLLGQMMRPSSQYGVLPDGAILDSLTGLTVAVSEVPTRAVGWLLLTLARHPQAAWRVAEEARTLPGDPGAVTAGHLTGLRYTEALVREVLRLHPPNWLLARRATRPTELAGYPVPPGTMVLVCPYSAHRDPREHPAPEEFRPERWLTEATATTASTAATTAATAATDDDATAATVPAVDPGVFLPFGTGPRSCEGIAVAMAELTLIAAETARRHCLHEPPGPGPSHRITTEGGLTPAGLRLRATPRAI